ncbi:Chk1 protein kinase, variant 2 [Mucor circinelloides]
MLIYMSPEQTGRTTFQPDHRTDLYSLGITFFVALTQSLPFAHSSPMEIVHNVLNKKLPSVHEVRPETPVVISMIIEKLTNKSPDERYTSAHGLREDLKECQQQLRHGNNILKPFPLGKFDIASIFTLPNNGCFGRTRELSLINTIIRRTAYMCGFNIRRRRSNNEITTAAAAAAVFTPLKLTTEEQSPTYKRVHNRNEASNGKSSSKVHHNRKRPTEIIAIYGNTGVGKSTLVRNVQQFAREYGYIAIAKFDTRQPTPYGCILRCLSIFLKNILTEPASEIERFRRMLKEQLGAETISQLPTLLVDNVPELASFLDQPSLQRVPSTNSNTSSGCECDMEGGEIKLRFHSAFIEIFQVMVNFKFVTLFLEDLHQADEASIELLDSLISAKLNFLVILTYRKSEVSSLITKLLRNENSIVSYVKIENLDQTALMELVRTTMHRLEEIDLVLLTPLVEFIYKRTHGNPFYACQLLMTLEKKNLIYFTWEKTRWEYNLQEIDKALLLDMKEDNNGDMDIAFLVRRLEELPRDGRKFLKWASFVGNNFNYETVRNLMMENEDLDDNDDATEEEEEEEEEEEDESLSQEDSGTDQDENTTAKAKQFPKVVVSGGKRKFDAINGLQSALQQGFIQTFNNDEFKFTHDRYSQAAMMLASPKNQDVFHLKIASHFMTKDNVDKFWVADHVKAALHLIKNKPIKSSYRKVLLQAGDKAFDSGAHKLAFSYYSAAQELLTTTEDPWVDGSDAKYSETLHLYTRLAEISWFMDYDLTRGYLTAILDHAQSAIDRAAAYRVQHRYRWSRAGSQESAPILLECLRELGVNDIQMNMTEHDQERLYAATRKEVLKVGMSNILKLPVCDSRLIRTRFSIMEELCLWAYWTNDMRAMLSVGSRFVLKTLKNGTTPTTGVGFVFFGIAVMQLFKAYEFGEQIGEIGVALCNNYGGNSESGRARYLYAAFLSSWKHPYHKSISMARLAMKQGLLGGDRIYATFAHSYLVIGSLLTGEHMSDVLRDAKNCVEEANSLGETVGTAILATTIVRVILAVQGKTHLSPETIFEDKDFNEAQFIQQAMQEHPDSDIQLYYYYAMKSITLGFFGFDTASIKLSSQHTHMSDSLPSARHTHLMFFFRCISFIRLMKSKEISLDNMDEMEKSRTRLAKWAQHSHPANLQMFITCIDAELAGLNNQHLKAQKLYDEAIRQARQGNWPLEVAVIHELAGVFYLQNDITSVACALIKESIATFRRIGLFGKANQLESKHKSLLKEFAKPEQAKEVSVQTETFQAIVKRESISDLTVPEPYSADMFNSQANSINNTSPEETLLTLDVVDLASILKSSQVISSEMNFELLMKQMLGIILENSGAESGVIIVKENTSFLIVGCGSQTDGCEIFNKPKLLSEEADSIITRISHYAIHAQESLFIVDVQQDSRFSDCTTQAKSCICTPIIHKTAIVGCIYIEGAVGSLTCRHEVVLRLLSQQIGISVTNALLFKSIQKVTYANVKMIENQKAALEEARKSKEAALHAMKLKADFLANMSHELRTPFSGFYGMISLLSETVLDAEQQDIVHTAKESCEMLLKIIDDLLNFSKLEAGKVALDLGPLVVEEVIADTIEILCSLSARKGLELAYFVDPEVPDTIITDSSRLRQILTNLLGNAIKFTHHGGVVIKCHVDKDDPEFADSDEFVRLKFEVIDTGIGIRSEQQKQLFEPFSQVDGSTTRMYGGTGLGLSICLQLVRLMMGEVGVESQPEQGSNFWFTIVANKQPKRIEDANSISKTAALKISLKKQTILLASQSDLNAKMIRSLLGDFAIKLTADMHQAVPKALQEHHPILILDIPAKPNNFIAHQLQSVDDDPECELHIILLYTPSTEGHKLAAEATNSASDRRGRLVKMAKPVRRAKLLSMLEQVLDQQQRASPMPQLPTPLGNRMKDYFEKDELSWYAQKPVLIAEDNMVAQKLLRKQLEKMGFLVESANNGEDAVKLWRERPPNYFCLGFFDHHMPKCDGVEATKRIRAFEIGTNSRLPIVALTADIQSSAKDVCFNAGMDGYLTKPLIPKDLATTLRKLNLAIHKHYDTPASSTPSSPLSSV